MDVIRVQVARILLDESWTEMAGIKTNGSSGVELPWKEAGQKQLALLLR